MRLDVSRDQGVQQTLEALIRPAYLLRERDDAKNAQGCPQQNRAAQNSSGASEKTFRPKSSPARCPSMTFVSAGANNPRTLTSAPDVIRSHNAAVDSSRNQASTGISKPRLGRSVIASGRSLGSTCRSTSLPRFR